MTVYHRQDVVKVVRHTACQLPDGFHLLCLAELIFEMSPVGDVARDPQRINNAPFLHDRRHRHLDGEYAAVLSNGTEFVGRRLTAAEYLSKSGSGEAAVILKNQPLVILSNPVGRRPTADDFARWVD